MASWPLPPPLVDGDVATRRELVYRVVLGHRPLALDLHVPLGAGPVPLVVYVHGGAFRLGHRRVLPAILREIDPFRALPALGIGVATVDYRLSGEATWPACVEDVAAAVAWLRRRGDEVGVDPERVAIWGESAGAYLAVKAGLGGFGCAPVRAVVSWYAPVDFGTMAEQGQPAADHADSPESELMGAPVQQVRDRSDAASLPASVTGRSPPLLVMHGTDDRAIPVAQARMLAAAYRRVGAPVTMVLVDGADHAFAGEPPERVWEPVRTFLRGTLT